MNIQLTGKPSAHFEWSDIVCQDGHNSLMFGYKAQRHLDMIEELRTFIGIIFRVSSWYRTFAHNASVGGENGSLHIAGQATDILFGTIVLKDPSLLAAMRILWHYINKKHGTIGAMIVYSWGIHFDSYDDPTHQVALRKGQFYFKVVS